MEVFFKFLCLAILRFVIVIYYYGKQNNLFLVVLTSASAVNLPVISTMGLDRRQALWEVSALRDRPIGMYEGQPSESGFEPQVQLPTMALSEHVLQDYAATSLSIKAHPVSFVREKLAQIRATPTKDLAGLSDGTPVRVAGLVLVRQRPRTASGICFITIEDETGNANLVVFPQLFDYYRKEVLQSKLLMAEGKLQKEGEVIHVIVERCFKLTGLLQTLAEQKIDSLPLLTLSRADEKDGDPRSPQEKKIQLRKMVQATMFPDGRNFKYRCKVSNDTLQYFPVQ